MHGTCLCGQVAFAVQQPLPDFYQCHCSQCRKLSGSASDTAMFLNAEQFRWLSGEEYIKSFSTPSGYRADFCGRCGSTVPHRMQNGVQFWVPAGLLDGYTPSRVSAHLCTDSMASWDPISGGSDNNTNTKHYPNMPEMAELDALLRRK